MTIQQQKSLINNYIRIIWNEGDTSRLHEFLHPDFIDHGLPPSLPANAHGLQQWVALTHSSFIPETVIESQVAEDQQCIIKISMRMKHIGMWRGILPTGKTVTVNGYRTFRFQDDRIIEHWALIDGAALEQALQGKTHVCAR
ncbi:MAG: ester cyclase [Chitinophaga sp.]|uniref:ester cyclase n=1 Tax=Chitinophaga sp. TaxID=1869181 RepID=UPI001B16861A|nr:ester cyclase [Chitinophaga sp.]MBO9729227.1 ester cyclase [Chitinophaga sp.]